MGYVLGSWVHAWGMVPRGAFCCLMVMAGRQGKREVHRPSFVFSFVFIHIPGSNVTKHSFLRDPACLICRRKSSLGETTPLRILFSGWANMVSATCRTAWACRDGLPNGQE